MCHVDKFRGPTQTSQNVTWKEGELPSKPLPTSTQLTCQGFDCASAKSTPNTPSFASWVAKGRLMAEREQCRNVFDADFGRDQRRDSISLWHYSFHFYFAMCEGRRVRKWADSNSSLLQDWWHLGAHLSPKVTWGERERESKCGMMGYVGPPWVQSSGFAACWLVMVWTLHLPYVDLLAPWRWQCREAIRQVLEKAGLFTRSMALIRSSVINNSFLTAALPT